MEKYLSLNVLFGSFDLQDSVREDRVLGLEDSIA